MRVYNLKCPTVNTFRQIKIPAGRSLNNTPTLAVQTMYWRLVLEWVPSHSIFWISKTLTYMSWKSIEILLPIFKTLTLFSTERFILKTFRSEERRVGKDFR